MGMALADGLVFASNALKRFGLREDVKIIAAGKLITAFDLAKVMALGGDACYSSRGMMFALGCIQALVCDSGKCPVGITTQDKSLYMGIEVTDKSVRIANFHKNTMKALADFIGACGFERPADLTPEVFFKRTEQNSNQSFAELYFSKRINQEETHFIHN